MGAGNSVLWVEQGKRAAILRAVSRVLYHLITMLARLTVCSGRSKDLEIIVLRHQLAVLRRQINRPAINDGDRTLLGAIGSALPRPHSVDWIVTPETLLRRHRRRIARHWTQPHRRPGRPSIAIEVRRRPCCECKLGVPMLA